MVLVSFIFYTPCLTLLSELWSDWQERKIYLDISGDINVYSSANQTHDKYRQSAIRSTIAVRGAGYLMKL